MSRTGNPDDYKGLFEEMNGMNKVTLKVKPIKTGMKRSPDGKVTCAVRLANPSDLPCFFIRLKTDGEFETRTVSYSDNYVSLLPGESKIVEIQVSDRQPVLTSETVRIEIFAWNCPVFSLEVPVVRS